MVIGSRICVITPKWSYHCIVYKRSRTMFKGRHYTYVIEDDVEQEKDGVR